MNNQDKRRITTLTRDNWEDWSRQVRLKLQSKGLWYTVEETIEEHAWTANPKGNVIEDVSAAASSSSPTWESGGTWNVEKKKAYSKDEASALLYMTLAMSRDDIDLLDEYETAKALWAGLLAKYSRTSESRANFYMAKIIQFELDESSDLDVAWSKLKEYRRRLVSANADMKNAFPDKALFFILTRSLPLVHKPTFDSFCLDTSMDIDEKDTKAQTAMAAKQRTPHQRRDSSSSNNSNGCY